MSRGRWAMPVLLALAAPLVAQGTPDRLEELLWQGAAGANTVAAYDTYLRRYPAGAHTAEARAALTTLGVAAAPAGAAAPAPVAPAPASPLPAPAAPPPAIAAAEPPAAASPLFLCRPTYATAAVALDRASEAELATYLQALRANSVEAYARYLDAFPDGVFAPAVGALVAERAARARALAATPIPGPVAAKLRHPIVPEAGDYPADARKAGAHGSATAVWEVAEDGCVQACRVETSSGSPALDEATCRVATARGRYDPARDGSGKPIRSVAGATVSWAAAN